MTTWLRRAVIVFAVLVLLLLLAMGVGSTAIGSRLLLASLPGVSSSEFKGSVFGAWQAKELTWRQGELVISLDEPDIDWSARCLLRQVLCIKSLKARQLTIELPDNSDPKEPFSLPEFELPLDLELGEIAIEAIQIGDKRFDQIQLIATGQGSSLSISQLSGRYGEYALSISGTVQTQGQWQSTLSAVLNMPPIDQRPWILYLGADGPLAGEMQVNLRGEGYLDAVVTGVVAPFGEGIPVELELTSERFNPYQRLPETLTLHQVRILGRGDLNQGYLLQGAARLEGLEGPVSVAIEGTVDKQQANVAYWNLVDHTQQTAQVSGVVRWSEALAIAAQLDIERFRWQTLYASDVPIEIKALESKVNYQSQKLSSHIIGQFIGPAGEFSLNTDLIQENSRYHLPNFNLSAGEGKAVGEVVIELEPALSWQTTLSISQLDPSYWLEELPGVLNGEIQSQGSLADPLSWQVDGALSGRLRGQVAELRVKGQGQGPVIDLPSLYLSVGDNRIEGSGALGQALKADLILNLNQLNQLWPGLAGQITGTLTAQGSLESPQGRAQLSAQGLRYQNSFIKSLSLDGTVSANQAFELSLVGQGLKQGKTDLGIVDLKARGDKTRQQLSAEVKGTKATVTVNGVGRFIEQRWQGELSQALIALQTQNWQLQAPMAIRYAPDSLELGAHCWLGKGASEQTASLCAGVQTILPTTQLDYRLAGFDLASLKPWLPDNFAWQGELNGVLALTFPAQGPRGQIRLDAGTGELAIAERGQWHRYAYQRLTLESRLSAQQIQSVLRFNSQELGDIEADIGLDPQGAKRLQGQVRVSGFDLALLEPFITQVDDFSGQINGQARVSGTLLEPRIDGAINVRNGRASGAELPIPIENLSLDLAIKGDYATLQGNWQGGHWGKANVSGTVVWQDQFQAVLQLDSSRMPVYIEPYANLEADAKLRFELSQMRLAISGSVDLPRGSIVIRELPPSTVKLSPDAVIVGQEQRAKDAFDVSMQVEVSVGRDQLSFSGFGLTADLLGQVTIGDNLDTRGTLDLNEGRYRAYGQRLTIRRARIFFAGPIDQPYVDVEAVRTVDDVIAGIRLNGNVKQPSTTIFSEPSMSQEQALSYLVLGRPLSSDSGEDSNMLGQAALALGLAGSASLTGGFANALGIQDFAIDTQGSGVGTSVVASGRITDKLSLRYGVGVFEPANTLALRYEISRRLYIEAASGFASSIDIFYKRDY